MTVRKRNKKTSDTSVTSSGDSSTKVKNQSKSKTKVYSGSYLQRGIAYLFERDDASYLAVFRILWGSIMAYEAYTYTLGDFGKMHGSFYSALFQFKYYGFEWCVVPENPLYMKILILSQLLLGIFITIGFFYRTSSLLFFLAFSYMYLLEQAMYLNHFYLVCVLSLMMVILPCNCLFSVDAYLWPKQVYSPTCPKWCLIFVKAELAIVYTYAGICKVNEDWLRGEPLRAWLAHRENTPLIGWILVRESTAYFMSYAGVCYDLIIAELLLWRRTLPIGILATLFFHCANKIVFNIGIFPWMMIASTTFFFTPDWPRRVYCRISGKPFVPIQTKTFKETGPRKLSVFEWLVIILLFVFLIHQVFTPLRLHTYPGTVGWNEYGHQFSWRMKLRTKKCDATGLVYTPEFHTAYQFPLENFLNRRQYRKMASRPDMIIQMAHYMAEIFDEQYATQYPNSTSKSELYIESWCELNARPYQPLTNATYNLAEAKKWESPYPWVTDIKPLTEEEKKNYPWNWDWNYNWFKGIDRLPVVKQKDVQRRAQLMKQNAGKKWEEWLLTRDPLVNFEVVKDAHKG